MRILRLAARCSSALLASTLAPRIGASAGSTPTSRDSGDLLGVQISAADALRAWGTGSAQDAVNRIDHDDVDPQRRVIVVVGITGAGKSSTANTLAGRTHKAFVQSNTVTSVTQAVSHRDYSFVNLPWRVIDTPGLCDTNRPGAAVAGELAHIERLAPHGIAAFVIVVPRGRLTPEHERALGDVVEVFGHRALRHALIAVTSATDTVESAGGLMSRDALLEEVAALPLRHFFRRLVADVGERVVPVENRLDTPKQISRMMLHQRILGLEDSLSGERYRLGPDFAAALAGIVAADQPPEGRRKGLQTSPNAPLALERCRQSEFTRASDGRRMWRLECEAA